MREYYVDMQPWCRWPKALIMHHNWYPNGHAHKHEVKRYIPADEFLAENDKIAKAYEECIAENAKLRELIKALLECHIEDADTCSKCLFKSPTHGGCMADVEADELGVE